jgi:hypothetical protein
MTKPLDSPKQFHVTKGKQTDPAAQELTKAVVSLCPPGITERDWSVLQDSLFESETKVGERHNISRGRVAQIKMKYRATWRALVDSRNKVVPHVAQAAAYKGVKKVAEFLDKPASNPQDIKDASMLTQTITQLNNISRPVVEAEEPKEKPPDPEQARKVFDILEIDPSQADKAPSQAAEEPKAID